MKICHFIASKGLGSGDFYIDLVNELAKNVNISLLIPKGAKYLHHISPQIEVIHYHPRSRYNPLFLYEIYTKIKLINPDIVHSHFAKASELFYIVNLFLKKTHIATKHNPRKGKIFNRISYVTAVSKEVQASISQKNIKLIYNGINPKKQREPNHSNQVFTICAIGRLEKIKGFDTLIISFAKLRCNAHLKIYGEGKERANLEHLISSLHLEDRVFLCGFTHDVEEKISQADAVIVSSISEGFSMVILESMLYGKLLISTPVGIAKEILDNKFLIQQNNFTEKIDDIVENYIKFKEDFSTFKNKYANKFILSNIAIEYINYYKECFANEK